LAITLAMILQPRQVQFAAIAEFELPYLAEFID
jgi:hypothetical protein